MDRRTLAMRIASLTCALTFTAAAWAIDQWTQWGGPDRNFMVEDNGLAPRWPEKGPKQLWKRPLGPGHSTIISDGERLYTMYRKDDQDVVVALRAADGNTEWEFSYIAPPKAEMLLDFGPGPHATPLLVGERLFTIGAMVNFHAIDRKTGKKIWEHDLNAEMDASVLGRGYGGSPIAYKDLVIVTVGSPKAGVAAFKQDSGELAWKSLPMRAGYPSPLLARINGEDHLILVLGTDRAGLDPATGEVRWRTTVDKQLATTISSPLFIPPDRVFCSAAYGGGSQLFQIKSIDGSYDAQPLWHDTKLKVHHGDVIRIGDVIYGSSGDFGPAFLMALDLNTQKVLWRDRGFSKATLVLADGKLIILDEQGWLALATAKPEGLEVHSKVKVLEDKAWSAPTLVAGKLYLRDNRTIMALDVSAGANPS